MSGRINEAWRASWKSLLTRVFGGDGKRSG